jgi:hypothetical protein
MPQIHPSARRLLQSRLNTTSDNSSPLTGSWVSYSVSSNLVEGHALYGFDGPGYAGNVTKLSTDGTISGAFRSIRMVRNTRISEALSIPSSTTVSINNQTPLTVHVFRVDADNNEVFVNRLPGGQHYVQHCSVDDNLVVRLEGPGKYLTETFALPEHTSITVTEEDVLRSEADGSSTLLNCNSTTGLNADFYSPDGTLQKPGQSDQCLLYCGEVYVARSGDSTLCYLFVPPDGNGKIWLLYTFSHYTVGASHTASANPLVNVIQDGERPGDTLHEGEVAFYTGENYTGECWRFNSHFWPTPDSTRPTGTWPAAAIPDFAAAQILSVKVGRDTYVDVNNAKFLSNVSDSTVPNGGFGDPKKTTADVCFTEVAVNDSNVASQGVFVPSKIQSNLEGFENTYRLSSAGWAEFARTYGIIDYGVHFSDSASVTVYRELKPSTVGMRVLNSFSEDVAPAAGTGTYEDTTVCRTTLTFTGKYDSLSKTIQKPATLTVYADCDDEELTINGDGTNASRDAGASVAIPKSGRVVITQKAVIDGTGRMGTPTLLVRTDLMTADERVVIHPEVDLAHRMKKHASTSGWARTATTQDTSVQDGYSNDPVTGNRYMIPDRNRTNSTACEGFQTALGHIGSVALYGTHEDSTAVHSHLKVDGRQMPTPHWMFGPHPSTNEMGFHAVGGAGGVTEAELDSLKMGPDGKPKPVYDAQGHLLTQTALKKLADDIVHVVVEAVEDVVHAVVYLEKSIVKFVVKVAEDVAHAIVALVKAIGAVVKDIVDAIKFLFDLPQYWKTGKILTQTVHDFLTSPGTVHGARPGLKTMLDNAIDPVVKKVTTALTSAKDKADAGIEHFFHNTGKTAVPTASHSSESWWQEALEKVEWILNKLESLGGGHLPATSPVTGGVDLSCFTKSNRNNQGKGKHQVLLDLQTGNWQKGILDAGIETIEGVAHSLTAHGAPTNALAVIGDFIEKILNEVMALPEEVVTEIKKILDSSITYVQQQLDAGLVTLLPEIGGLIEWLLKKVGLAKKYEPTVLEVVSFVCAIPLVIASAIANGEDHADPLKGTVTGTLWLEKPQLKAALKDVDASLPVLSHLVSGIEQLLAAKDNAQLMIKVGANEGDSPGGFDTALAVIKSVYALTSNILHTVHLDTSDTEEDLEIAAAWSALAPKIADAVATGLARFDKGLDGPTLAKAHVVINAISGAMTLGFTTALLKQDSSTDFNGRLADIYDGLGNVLQLLAFVGDEDGVAEVGAVIVGILDVGSSVSHFVEAGYKGK